MPESSIRPTSTRKQTDPRDFFSFTTPNLKVTAHPTDPYVKLGADPNLSAFIDSMKNVDTLTDGFVKLQTVQKKENTQRATVDARKPGAQPDAEDPNAGLLNMGVGYKEAYNITMGEDRGQQYRNELLQGLKDRNHFQNEPDPDAAYQKFNQDLYTHHFGSVQDNPQLMFGASAHVKEAVNAGALAMHEANTKTFKDNFANTTNRVQQGMLSDYSRGDHSPESAAQLRKLLADEWELRVKPMNLMSRDEYSRTVVNNIGTVALKLMDDRTVPTSEAFANAIKLTDLFEVPDTQTAQSYSTMTDGEGKYKFRAEIDQFHHKLNTMKAARDEADTKAVQRMQDSEAKDLFVNVVLDPKLTLEQKQQAITRAKWINHTDMEGLVQKAETFHKEEKNIVQDYPVINGLRERIEMSTNASGLNAIRKEIIRAYGVTLNAATSRELQERITSRLDHITSETRANRAQAMMETQEEKKLGYENLARIVGKKQIGEDGREGALRVNDYGRLYFARVNSGMSPVAASKELVDYFSKTQGTTTADIHGTSSYPSEAAIAADVKSGKLKPDLGMLEILKFRSQKRPAAAPKEEPGVFSKLGATLGTIGSNLKQSHREKDDWRFTWEDE